MHIFLNNDTDTDRHGLNRYLYEHTPYWLKILVMHSGGGRDFLSLTSCNSNGFRRPLYAAKCENIQNEERPTRN